MSTKFKKDGRFHINFRCSFLKSMKGAAVMNLGCSASAGKNFSRIFAMYLRGSSIHLEYVSRIPNRSINSNSKHRCQNYTIPSSIALCIIALSFSPSSTKEARVPKNPRTDACTSSTAVQKLCLISWPLRSTELIPMRSEYNDLVINFVVLKAGPQRGDRDLDLFAPA
jgi:hypothetical protein